MPTERDVIVVAGPDGKVPTASEVQTVSEQEQRDFTAKMAIMLDRGWTNARINVEVPPGIHGEWVFNSPAELARIRNLGGKIDTKYAAKNALHNDGSGNPILGDVIFCVWPKWQYDIIKKLERDKANSRFSSKHAEAPNFPTGIIPVDDRGVQTDLKDNQGLATSISEENMNQPKVDSFNGASGT